GSLSQADGLFKWVAAEATARSDVTVNRMRGYGRQGDLDPRAECRPVRFLALQLDREPMIGVSGILEHHAAKAVSRRRPAEFLEEINVAIAVPVAASDAVSLLQMAGTA